MVHIVNNTVTDALMLVGGGVVGAGLALLLAPHSGRKTRREIVGLGTSIGRKGGRAVRDLRRNVTGFATTVGDKAAGVLREGQKLTIAGKKEVVTAIEKGSKTLVSRKLRLARIFG